MSDSANAVLLRWGLFPLRLAVGVTFLMHGWQKLFVFGLGGTAEILQWLGIPFPAFFAGVVMATELLGGLSLMLGLFARWAGVFLAVDMFVAILVARMKGGFFTPNGFEFELVLLGASLTIAAIGTGAVSLDRLIRRPN